MRWWFCTASSPRSSTSNPKAAVLRRHRPKNGGTGISRFRRFCLIAVATPSRAGPDTGGRARPSAADPPIRRSAAVPLPRRPVAPSPRRPAAPLLHGSEYKRFAARQGDGCRNDHKRQRDRHRIHDRRDTHGRSREGGAARQGRRAPRSGHRHADAPSGHRPLLLVHDAGLQRQPRRIRDRTSEAVGQLRGGRRQGA